MVFFYASFTSLKLHGLNHLATLPFGKQRTCLPSPKALEKICLKNRKMFDIFRIFIQGKNKTSAVWIQPSQPVAGCCVSTRMLRAAGFLNFSHPESSLQASGGRDVPRNAEHKVQTNPPAILTFEKRSKVFRKIS